MAIKITAQVEINADLNAYYPQFEPSLRRAIDAAVVKLAGGVPRGPNRRAPREGGFPLYRNATLMLTDKTPTKGFTRMAMMEVIRRMNGFKTIQQHEFLEAIEAALKAAGRDGLPEHQLYWARVIWNEGFIAIAEDRK